jgi:hypothetical protein
MRLPPKSGVPGCHHSGPTVPARGSHAVVAHQLEVDYENGAFKFDAELSGPVVGATIHF